MGWSSWGNEAGHIVDEDLWLYVGYVSCQVCPSSGRSECTPVHPSETALGKMVVNDSFGVRPSDRGIRLMKEVYAKRLQEYESRRPLVADRIPIPRNHGGWFSDMETNRDRKIEEAKEA